MKLNCDVAEGFGSWSMGPDSDVMPYIDMANIACGFHASDPFIMAKTVRLAKQQGVSVGAHPGYPDLLGFGRRDIVFSHQEITELLQYQIGALQAICRAQGMVVDYVKPHGALYNLMMRDEQVLLTIMKAVAALSADTDAKILPLMVLANNKSHEIKQQAEKIGLSILLEAFCDRAYNDDGSLVPRAVEGAVLDDASIEKRISELVNEKIITTVSGKKIPIHADTICFHGDSQHALKAVRKIKSLIHQD